MHIGGIPDTPIIRALWDTAMMPGVPRWIKERMLGRCSECRVDGGDHQSSCPETPDPRLERFVEAANSVFNEVKDSGERQEFDTGSVRDSRKGKGRFDLLPPSAIKRVARHFEFGAVKYGDRNWEKGQPLTRYADSALRHLFAALDGAVDEDHLAAVAWNIMALMETMERITLGQLPMELDDWPHYWPGRPDSVDDLKALVDRLDTERQVEETHG